MFQYKDGLSRYKGSHYKDKTVMRSSYLYNGNPNIEGIFISGQTPGFCFLGMVHVMAWEWSELPWLKGILWHGE